MATEQRLTEKHYNGKGYYMKCSGLCHFDGHCANCDELVKIVDRLGEYEDKAEQAVDAGPVIHGQWVNPCINRYGHPCHCCSVCGFKASYQDKNYCPNCGAKMDEGKRNGLNPDVVIVDEPEANGDRVRSMSNEKLATRVSSQNT